MAFYKIIGNTIGNDAGPFTIKTNAGVTLATGVTRLQILAGYTVNVPTGATSLEVTSDPANTDCVTEQSFPIPNEGFWEMEKSNVETISDHYGAIQANYVSPVETFVADDVVGIYTGVVGTGGNWLIKGGPEDIAGTTYNGGGLLILTANNTPNATTIQTGATVQLGRDVNALTGAIGYGLTTVQAGATLNILGANEDPGRPVIADLSNLGNVNITGPDVCGEGNFRNVGYWDNRSLVTIDNARFTFNNPTTFTANAGTILVKDGATLNVGVAMPNTQTLQINGCGKCSAFGLEEGAITYGAAVTIASPIQVQTDSCMKANGAGPTVFSGPITGSAVLDIDNYAGTSTRSGTATFNNNVANFTGTVNLGATSLLDGAANTWANAHMVMGRNAYIQTTTPKSFKSLSSSEPTANITTNGSFGANITLTQNGITEYAGLLANSTPATPTLLTVNGPSSNQLFLSNSATGQWYQLKANDGSKIILNGGSYAKLNAEQGGSISAGKSLTSTASSVYSAAADAGSININNGILAVKSISPTQTGLLTTQRQFNVTGTFTVDLDEPLDAGTYDILAVPGKTGTGYLTLPTTGVNNTGRTVVSYQWNTTTGRLSVTLA